MLNILINLKVIFSAIFIKIKKFYYKNYDPYLPLPKKLFLSPSSKITEEYRYSLLKMSYLNSKIDPLKWQNIARKKLSEISGYEEKRKKTTISLLCNEKRITNKLYRRKVYLKLSLNSDVPINLIYKKPLKKNLSVFIYLAGSTSGAHIGWGETKVPIDHQRIHIGADMAKQAAEKGYLALTFEQAGYGERLERILKKKSASRTIDFANHLLLLGKSLMGNGSSEISSVIDWLCSDNKLYKINKNNIYIYGHSAGGTLAQYVSALDQRIKVTLASGSVGPIRETIGVRGCGGGDGIIPGFLKWFDTNDILSLIAPRVFIGLSGDRDHIFPYSGVKKVVTKAKPIYKKLNASNNLISIKTKGKHQYYSREAWEALEKYISP